METIKCKVFDVLVEKITISKFENWLYVSEEILVNLNENSFYFDLISINYKSKEWRNQLIYFSTQAYGDCFETILKIYHICKLIAKSENPEETYSALCLITDNFDYEADYSILWQLYSLYDYFNLVKEGLIRDASLYQQAKFYSNQVLDIISNGEDFESIKKQLELNLIEFTS